MIRISRRSQSVKAFFSFALHFGATLRVNRLWRLNGKRKHEKKSEILWVIRGGFLKWQFVKDCCYFLMPAMVFIIVVFVALPCAYLSRIKKISHKSQVLQSSLKARPLRSRRLAREESRRLLYWRAGSHSAGRCLAPQNPHCNTVVQKTMEVSLEKKQR